MFLSINWGNALIVTFFGFAIVIVVLIILTYIMEWFGKMMAKTNKKETKAPVSVPIEEKSAKGPLTEAESAAVALALYQYCNAHDEESLVLTFNKSEQPSPWSSKVYGINNLNK
jgi:glutaconyl-CoA/methylmalonyl-CoA decarboxylase subunit delta